MTKTSITLLSISLFLLGCNGPRSTDSIREGDLLFQDLDCEGLCEAIETVTEGVDGKNFSHCAMVVSIKDELKVVEAIGNKVQLNSLENFFKRSGDTSEVKNITVGRMKKEFQDLIQGASNFALKQVGAPYDEPFLLNNGKWYCSELLYEGYKAANGGKEVFQLFPMTFKDPKTDDFFPAWVEYYEELGQDIPEGALGLNPGSISRSDKIEVLEIDFHK